MSETEKHFGASTIKRNTGRLKAECEALNAVLGELRSAPRMTMVEKVARALEDLPEHAGPYEWARTAIEAMRVPTAAMVKTGVDFALAATVSGDGGWPRYIAEKHAAMIDAALKEEAK